MKGLTTNLWGMTAALAVAAMLFASCGKKEEKAAEAPLVDVYEVGDDGGLRVKTFTGKTKSASEVNLAFRVAGQIQRVLVNEGDYVRKGQVVAEMDSRDYEVQLAATQAEYDGIKAEAERVIALFKEGNTTQSNYDKARYGLQQITQKLANHRNQLADTKLRSTIDGYVGTKLHESGETVGAGMPVVSVFGSGNVEVEIKISAADFANIDNIASFYCKFDITGDERFPMTVARKSQEANSSQLYTVRLRPNPQPLPSSKGNKVSSPPVTPSLEGKGFGGRGCITPGMSTIVYAEASSADNQSMVNIPSTALLEKDGKASVYVFNESAGTVKLQTVDVTALHRNGTADIASGLKQGDVIVCTGVHHINDGQKVRRMPKQTKSNVGGML